MGLNLVGVVIFVYLLEQKGEVIAALVPPDHLEARVQQDTAAATKEVGAEESARRALFNVMDKVKAKNLEFSEEEVEQDIIAAREEVRHSNRRRPADGSLQNGLGFTSSLLLGNPPAA